MKSILDFEDHELVELNIKECLNQLVNLGITASFVALSRANGCSIYFKDNNDVKYRFSDHSVSNVGRIFNEVHFKLPYRITGSIANQFNCKDKSKFGFRERFVLYNDNINNLAKSYSYIF